jgi:hypothetical protein
MERFWRWTWTHTLSHAVSLQPRVVYSRAESSPYLDLPTISVPLVYSLISQFLQERREIITHPFLSCTDVHGNSGQILGDFASLGLGCRHLCVSAPVFRSLP